MLDTEQINDLHRLYWSERWSIRKIERHLKMGWRTISKYLEAPAQGPARRSRSSKLDSFKGNIAEWLEKDPQVTAAVIEQRLRPLGYDGGSSILQEYVRKVRPQLARAEPSYGWSLWPAKDSRWTGATSARSPTRAIRASSMPLPSSMPTAE
jgi:transposase